MWFPVRQHPGHRVPDLGLVSHVEVGIMSKLESQHISGVINQNVFPCIRGLGKIPKRDMIQCEDKRTRVAEESDGLPTQIQHKAGQYALCSNIQQDNIEELHVLPVSQYILMNHGEGGTLQIKCK